ncbi:MarR family winged helix-turn-helix transcriptional regulator [Paraburkholderia acidipaludis]|uniref:MarR family winged helix-turn-helix transcriptional regulator n=1 Tax=Paraburkholderia acidipaludis TaxID=660537 RepID=UPI0004832586|nr:MarR family transcriptional regulator [Paraburkholderia acidipaludis]
MTRQNAPSRAELPAQLASEIRALMAKLRRRLREQASPGEFTPSQVAVLVRLEREGAGTVSSLARAEGMRPQSMGAVIAQLEAMGLLSAAPDPEDGRQTLWSLTDACAAWLREGRAARQDWLTRAIEARLSADEQRELAAALDLLQRLAQA